jgi:6-phosphofructokinase 1
MVVAQSGGPSPVINSSLRGIIEAARQFDAIGTVYGGRHGIEGVLKEELIDLSAQPAEEGNCPVALYAGRGLDWHLPLQA